MIISFLKSMLGPLSPLLDFVMEEEQTVAIILIVLIAVYFAGRVQLNNIKNKSEMLVIELGREITRQKPHITKSGLYKKIYPQWADSIGSWGLFVPSKHDLYPVRVKPETVSQKIDFSPDWIASILQKNQIILDEMKSMDEVD